MPPSLPLTTVYSSSFSSSPSSSSQSSSSPFPSSYFPSRTPLPPSFPPVNCTPQPSGQTTTFAAAAAAAATTTASFYSSFGLGIGEGRGPEEGPVTLCPKPQSQPLQPPPQPPPQPPQLLHLHHRRHHHSPPFPLPSPPSPSLSRTNPPPPPPPPPPLRKMGRANKAAPANKHKERRTLKAQPPQVQVNYPCHGQNALSRETREQLSKMKLHPADGVHRYTRRIPFKGLKATLSEATGRNHFDVYEYRFVAENTAKELKEWWVMWDYYNGLVRVHDLFDCCKPGKTEPGNALKEKINPGLAVLCPNITGGNLDAQGYWIPFEAARALAAKFCYRIRYALTIIFGDNFPETCLSDKHADFGKYAIDPAIIALCRQRADAHKKRETEQVLRRDEEEEEEAAAAVAAAAVATLTPAKEIVSRYATPAESTPGRSYQLATPEMGVDAMPREQRTRYFFDPVRDDFTSSCSGSGGGRSGGGGGGDGSRKQDVAWPPPGGCWSNAANLATPTPSFPTPFGSPIATACGNSRRSVHCPPYLCSGSSTSSCAVARRTPSPTPIRAPQSPQMPAPRSPPAESLVSNDIVSRPPYHQQHQQHQQPVWRSMSPGLEQFYHPAERSLPSTVLGEYPRALLRHHSSPSTMATATVRCHEEDEHDCKRRRVFSRSPEYFGPVAAAVTTPAAVGGGTGRGRDELPPTAPPFTRTASQGELTAVAALMALSRGSGDPPQPPGGR